jgi:glycosyltransferase involved in cell wall biosynthesis
MRLCLVAHGFPPLEKAGVENFTAQLARGLAREGHAVEVFVPRVRPDLPDLSIRHERRDGFGVHWLSTNSGPRDPAEQLDPPGRAEHFDRFLERERPELVHFHHVTKLGLGLIEAAHARGIPTVYTVHDYYPVCHRITLLRPDMRRCTTIGDPEACARCDLALAVLNDCPQLGDYHIGAFEGSLGAAERARLAATLGGDESGSGFEAPEWDEARARRRELDQRRLGVYRQVDRLVAPTEFLRDRMVEGGIDPQRLVHIPYGIDTDALVDLPRADVAELSGRPLRIGFVGSLTKHKGAHVLLEAFEELSDRAELHLWGDSTDRVYVESCRARAEAVGARWHGAFDQHRLPGILGSVDLVVVPSIWVENYPIAIREALAAGRPVVASRVGALPESVRDGVDGLLFEVGSAADLRRALRELIDEPARVVALREAAAPVKSLEHEVAVHQALYREVIDAVTTATDEPHPLPHLRGVAASYGALQRLSNRELFTRALQGIDRLGGMLSCGDSAVADSLSAAFARGSQSQEHLRDRTTERDYLRAEIERRERDRESLDERLRWRESQVFGLERSVADLRRECEWHAGTIAHLREQVQSLEKERDWMAETVTGLREQVGSLEAERDWRAGNERNLGEKAGYLEQEVKQRDREVEHLRHLVGEREAELDRSRSLHEEQAAGLRARIESAGRELDVLRSEVGDLADELERVDAERRWRASEMRDAYARATALRARLIPARVLLKELIERWSQDVDRSEGSAAGGSSTGGEGRS